MHRTEGPDYATVGGKRRFKETPVPATIVDKDIMNAMQEEIALVIENSGLTLNTDGATDESAGWGQLDTAILRRGIANVVSFGADPTGVADSSAAFIAAFAGSEFVYVPEGIFKISSTVTIPDYGFLFGSGQKSRIHAGTNAITLFQISNTSGGMQNLYISGYTQPNIKLIDISLNNTVHRVVLKDLWFNDYEKGVKIISSADNLGLVYLDTIYSTNIDAGGIFIAASELTGESCPRVIASHLHGIDFASGDYVLEIDGASGVADRLFSECNFVGGRINIRIDKGFIISNSFLDVDAYYFEGNNCARLIKNTIGSSKSNTVNNSTTARTFWEDNRLNTGILDGSTNISGILVKRTRISSAQTITTGNNANVAFNGETHRKMANNASYTKDDPWDSGNSRFDVQGFGDGRVIINAEVLVKCDTQNPTDIDSVFGHVHIDGSKVFSMRQIVLLAGAAAGYILFQCSITLNLDSTQTIAINIENGQAGSITIETTYGIYSTNIEIEGL